MLSLRLRVPNLNVIRLLAGALLALWSFASPTPGHDLVASLDYGTFEGAYSQEYNISYWQKIPYAAPLVGENQFRAPQPPLNITNGTYNSSQPFDMCPQRTVSWHKPQPPQVPRQFLGTWANSGSSP